MHNRPRARTEDVFSEWADEDLVVYDQSNRTAHSLTATAAAIWKACDGERTSDAIAHDLRLELRVVEHTVEELSDCGLLDAGPTVDLGHRVSRREAAKRFAKVSAAALAAPMIYSVAVPAGAMAASACTVANGGTVNSGHCTASSGSFGTSTNGPPSQCCQSGVCYKNESSNTYVCVASITSCLPFGGLCAGGLLGPCCAGSSFCTGIITLTCSQ